MTVTPSVTATLTYVYCLVRSFRRPALRHMPAGMPDGGAVRVIDAGDEVWLVASSVPAAAYGQTAIAQGLQNMEWVGRRAVAHEAVVERFLKARSLVPMQLFTLFSSDARAVAGAAGDRSRLMRLFDRLERQVEWGLRAALDAPPVAPGGPAPRVTSGAEYLTRKRDVLHAARERARAAVTATERLYRATARAASEAVRRPPDEGPEHARLLLDAAFLVPAAGTAAFHSIVGREAEALQELGVTVTLTGPWPPYHFVRVDAAGRQRRTSAATAKAAARRRANTPRPGTADASSGRARKAARR